jgi:hypothetical protein
VTLWPIQDAAEEAATRATAFVNDNRAGGYGSSSPEILLLPELRMRPEAVAAWQGAIADVHQLTDSAMSISMVEQFSEDFGAQVAAADSQGTATRLRRASLRSPASVSSSRPRTTSTESMSRPRFSTAATWHCARCSAYSC